MEKAPCPGEGGHVLGLGTAPAALPAALSGKLPQEWVILAKSGGKKKKATLIIYEKYAPHVNYASPGLSPILLFPSSWSPCLGRLGDPGDTGLGGRGEIST